MAVGYCRFVPSQTDRVPPVRRPWIRPLATVACAIWVAGAAARTEPQGALPAAASPARLSRDWSRIRSAHFEAVGNAPAADLRRAVGELEAFRGALAALFPGVRLESPVPTVIVAFRDSAAFDRYRPRDVQGRPAASVAGYFSARAHVNLITFDARASEDGYAAVFHEFAHYAMARNMPTLPLWLSEGVAEFLSTFRAAGPGGKGVIGLIPQGRLRAFEDGAFIPLKTILSPPAMEDLWNSNRIGLFYAEAWALVHYLATGPGLPIDAYVRALRETSSTEDAFRKAFGMEVAAAERALQQYVRRFSFGSMSLNQSVSDTSAATEPMREADVRALLGDILLGSGAFEEADREFLAALRLDPSQVDARVGHARVQAHTRDEAAGIAALADASNAAPSSFSAAFYLAVALDSAGRHDQAMAAYERALAISPEVASALVGLSAAALALGRDDEAEVAFARALRADASAIWYRNRGYAAFAAGRDDVAIADVRAYLDRVGWSQEGAPYSALMAAIAARRSSRPQEADALLEQAARAVAPKTWTSTVVQFLRGGIEATSFLARAKNRGQKTEAHAYVGLTASLAGRRDEALVHLRWVAAEGVRNYSEYDMARREIVRLTEGAR